MWQGAVAVGAFGGFAIFMAGYAAFLRYGAESMEPSANRRALARAYRACGRWSLRFGAVLLSVSVVLFLLGLFVR
jgi:hypothetical protein